MGELTACRDCEHLIQEGGGTIWYDLTCAAHPLPKVFDPYKGCMVDNDPPHRYVREINDGNCPDFKQKSAYCKLAWTR